MNCQEITKLIEAYLEGDLDSRQKQDLHTHLEACPSCRKEFENFRKLETVLQEAFTFQQADQQAADSVMTQIPEQPAPVATRPIYSVGKIAAGLFLAAGLAIGFYAGRQSAQKPFLQAPATSYQVSQLEGTVLVRHPDSDIWMPLRADSKIYAGDQFLSTPDGRVRFEAGAGSFVELSENSMLVFNHIADQTDLQLVHGTLDASLKSPHEPFFVTTPHGRAEALGTEFSVTVE